MGAMLCEIHGGVGSIFGCTHIHNYFPKAQSEKQNEVKPDFDTIFLTRLIFTKPLKIPGRYCYCNMCSLEYKFCGRGFSEILHLLTNCINVYRFIEKDSKVVCIICLFIECFGSDQYHERIFENNLNTPIKIRKI